MSFATQGRDFRNWLRGWTDTWCSLRRFWRKTVSKCETLSLRTGINSLLLSWTRVVSTGRRQKVNPESRMCLVFDYNATGLKRLHVECNKDCWRLIQRLGPTMTLIISSTACDFEFILSFLFVPYFHIGHDGGLQPVESAVVGQSSYKLVKIKKELCATLEFARSV